MPVQRSISGWPVAAGPAAQISSAETAASPLTVLTETQENGPLVFLSGSSWGVSYRRYK